MRSQSFQQSLDRDRPAHLRGQPVPRQLRSAEDRAHGRSAVARYAGDRAGAGAGAGGRAARGRGGRDRHRRVGQHGRPRHRRRRPARAQNRRRPPRRPRSRRAIRRLRRASTPQRPSASASSSSAGARDEPDCRPIIPMGAPDPSKADEALARLDPEGGTPIGQAMITAKLALDATGLSRRHLLLVPMARTPTDTARTTWPRRSQAAGRREAVDLFRRLRHRGEQGSTACAMPAGWCCRRRTRRS